MAYGLWSPSEFDTCTKEQHDAYRVVGPDGKWYPTWHPPVDPGSGCTFGHEHGRDPSGSDLIGAIEPLGFGYANEVLMLAGSPTALRHEDHVGHKLDWINDVSVVLGTEQLTCDVLVKLHQGTHSKDAFTNNVHEIFYHAGCSNGLTVNIRMLTAIGPAGEFTESCDLAHRVPAGTATPFDSPRGDGDSRRRIPTANCYGDNSLTEQWSTFSTVRAANGALLADFNPYVKTHNPSRVFAPEGTDPVVRPLLACDTGPLTSLLSRLCAGLQSGTPWNHPSSPLRGDNRTFAFNRLTVPSSDHQVWYTNAYGRGASPTPFPNSIRQVISGSTAAGYQGRIRYLGTRQGDFHATGVHAPN